MIVYNQVKIYTHHQDFLYRFKSLTTFLATPLNPSATNGNLARSKSIVIPSLTCCTANHGKRVFKSAKTF